MSGKNVIQWTLPTTRVDSSSLPPSQIQSVTISRGTAPGGPYTSLATLAGNATVYVDTPVPTGAHTYVVYVTDTQNSDSANSAEVAKTTLADPSAPSGVTIT